MKTFFEKTFNLVNRIGSTPEIYKKEVPDIIANMIYNTMGIDISNGTMITGTVKSNKNIFIIYSDNEKFKEEPVITRILSLDDNDNFILLIRDDILDLDIEEKIKHITYIYSAILVNISNMDNVENEWNLLSGSIFIMSLISLKGLYNAEHVYTFLKCLTTVMGKIISSKVDLNFKNIFNYVWDVLEADEYQPVTDETLIHDLIDNYRLYEFTNKKEEK